MPRLVLTCGVAGSGKSTYARALERQGWLRLSIDVAAHARGLTVHPLPQDITDQIRTEQRASLVTALREGRDVVVDYAFWARAQREDYRDLGRQHGADVEIVWFDVGPEELRRRLCERDTREGADAVHVPAVLLDRYLAGFEAPGPDETDVTRVAPSAP